MLRALPTIVKADPSVLYIVLGATHPEVLHHEGKSYKFKLDKIIKELGLEKSVVFHNHFVSDEELFQFLGAADIYVTPYLHREQLTSGTLAFAVGTGKAVVSTPYWAGLVMESRKPLPPPLMATTGGLVRVSMDVSTSRGAEHAITSSATSS